jgi:hypothetical protein
VAYSLPDHSRSTAEQPVCQSATIDRVHHIHGQTYNDANQLFRLFHGASKAKRPEMVITISGHTKKHGDHFR